MRRNTKFTLILILMLILATVFTIIGCSGKPIDKPNLRYLTVNKDGVTNGVISWNGVQNAKDYLITYESNGKVVKTSTKGQLSYVLPSKGKFKITCEAVASDSKKYKNSVSTIEGTFALPIDTPQVVLDRYIDRSIKYSILNYSYDAKKYMMTIDGKPYDITSPNGIISADLSDGEHNITLKAIGDNNVSYDSKVYQTKIDMSKVGVIKVDYETKDTSNNLSINLDYKNKKITKVEADFKLIDRNMYSFDATTGDFIMLDDVILSRDSIENMDLYIAFEDGYAIVVNITIIDNREVNFDNIDYINVKGNKEARINFNIYNNELIKLEKQLNDGSVKSLTKDKDFTLSKNKLTATLVVKNIDKDKDDKLVFTFKNSNGNYTRVLTFYFMDSDFSIQNRHNTFNLLDSNRMDMNIVFNQNMTITSAYIDYGAKLDTDYTMSEGKVTIKKSFLDKLPSGTILHGRLLVGRDDFDSFVIHVINDGNNGGRLANFEKLSYDYLSQGDLKLKLNSREFNLKAISIDGLTIGNAAYLRQGDTVTLNHDMLASLPYGNHELRLHVETSSRGTSYDIVTNINIMQDISNLKPTDVNITINNTYPDLSVNFAKVSSDVSTYVLNTKTSKKYYGELGTSNVVVPSNGLRNGDTYKVVHELNGKEFASDIMTYNASNVSNIERYYSAKFTYMADRYDAVLSSKDEFNIFTHYAFMHMSKMKNYNINVLEPNDSMLWSKLEQNDNNRVIKNGRYMSYHYEYSVKVYVPFISFSTDKQFKDTIVRYIDEGAKTYKEPARVDYLVEKIGGENSPECLIKFRLWSSNVPYPLGESGHDIVENRYNVNIEPAYATKNKTRQEGFDDFAINRWEKSQEVYIADELYYLIEDGVRPIPKPNSPAEFVYNEAKKILRDICDDNMSDHQKYMAIFEWIENNVTYDDNTAKYEGSLNKYDDVEYSKIFSRRCFFLEGVFIDHVAVCNGLAKAIVVMAGIEGIESIKVVGSSGNGRHAWNKVKLDGIWYNSDPTWAGVNWTDQLGKNENNKIPEGLNHIYTLANDINFNTNHSIDTNYDYFKDKFSNIDFDYFANRYVSSSDDKVHTLIINNVSDIDALVDSYVDYVYDSKANIVVNKQIMVSIVNNFGKDFESEFASRLSQKTNNTTWNKHSIYGKFNVGRYGKDYDIFIFDVQQ